MLKILVRRSTDISYLTNDLALEIDGLRDGLANWSPLHPEEAANPADVLSTPRRSAVVGYDLIFAAPRPTSILLAVGTNDEQIGVIRAHRAAVSDALEYLERRAVVVKRQILGDEHVVRASWRSTTGFTHGVNRLDEPHLHDHVLVSSVDARMNRVIDGRSLFMHSRSADAIYRATLRGEVRSQCGRDSWRSLSGHEYVSGIDEGLRALWSGHNVDSAPKRHVTRDEIERKWNDDLDLAWRGPQVSAPLRERDLLDEHAFQSHFEGRHIIERRDVVEAWADAASFGTSPGSVDRAIDRWYPELGATPSRSGPRISRDAARQIQRVHERGPRSLDEPQRDGRDRSLERRSLSRDR